MNDTESFGAGTNPRAGFDYTPLGDNLATLCRDIAARIRNRTTEHVVEIGRELIRIKEQIEYGYFTDWVQTECDIEIRTAENYMKAARWADTGENVSLLPLVPLSVIYELAVDDLPPEVGAQIVSVFRDGGRVTAAAVKRQIAEAKRAEKEAIGLANDFLTKLTAVSIKKVQHRRALLYINTELLCDWEREEREAFIAEVIEAIEAGEPDDDPEEEPAEEPEVATEAA